MTAARKKPGTKGKPTGPPAGGKKPRNPFAGRPQSGAGFHTEDKYTKKDRRKGRKELEKEIDEDAGK